MAFPLACFRMSSRDCSGSQVPVQGQPRQLETRCFLLEIAERMSLVSSAKSKSGSLMKNITMCKVCAQSIACLAGFTKCTTTITMCQQCVKSLKKNMVPALVQHALVHSWVHGIVALVYCALHCWHGRWVHCASCFGALCIGTLCITLMQWCIVHVASHYCKRGWPDERGKHHGERY